jgi:hypothetical protein
MTECDQHRCARRGVALDPAASGDCPGRDTARVGQPREREGGCRADASVAVGEQGPQSGTAAIDSLVAALLDALLPLFFAMRFDLATRLLAGESAPSRKFA